MSGGKKGVKDGKKGKKSFYFFYLGNSATLYKKDILFCVYMHGQNLNFKNSKQRPIKG